MRRGYRWEEFMETMDYGGEEGIRVGKETEVEYA
jgi:hypothetical protein